jgi:hypothetical protein
MTQDEKTILELNKIANEVTEILMGKIQERIGKEFLPFNCFYMTCQILANYSAALSIVEQRNVSIIIATALEIISHYAKQMLQAHTEIIKH